MNYFELFQLPVSLELDVAALSDRYRELQRQYHPDTVAAADESVKLAALQQTTTINDAYNTLKNPLARAEYLLSLQGIDVRNEQRTVKDTAFLMEQLEWREQLDAMQQSPDETAITRFQLLVKQHRERYFAELTAKLAVQSFEDAADLVRKLRFIEKMNEELNKLEETLFDL